MTRNRIKSPGSRYARSDWRWFGNSGHLIVGRDCRFHLATLVGPWWVSTVGEYLPDIAVREITAEVRGIAVPEGIRGDAAESWWLKNVGYEPIGGGKDSLYETMVFRAGPPCMEDDCGQCGAPYPTEWDELDGVRYVTAGEATRGHEAMCEKWAERPAGSGAAWEDDE